MQVTPSGQVEDRLLSATGLLGQSNAAAVPWPAHAARPSLACPCGPSGLRARHHPSSPGRGRRLARANPWRGSRTPWTPRRRSLHAVLGARASRRASRSSLSAGVACRERWALLLPVARGHDLPRWNGLSGATCCKAVVTGDSTYDRHRRERRFALASVPCVPAVRARDRQSSPPVLCRSRSSAPGSRRRE